MNNAARLATPPAPAPVASLPGRAGAVALGIVPHAAKLPVDLAALDAIATLSFCPVRGAERRARADHLACLIDAAIVAG